MSAGGSSRVLRGGLVVAAGLLLLVGVWWPFLSRPTFVAGWPDWPTRAAYASYTVTSLVTHGELPFWATASAYHQIHAPQLHGFFSNPETEVLSPYVPLFALFNFATAVRISLVVHLLVGVVGLYLLLSSRGVRHVPVVLVSAVLLFGSGFFVRHLLIGHFQFVSYTYFPLALWFYLRALEAPRLTRKTWRLLFCSGLVVACAYYEGNVHLVIDFLVTLAVLTAFTALFAPGRRLRTLACLPAAGLAFALLAGLKLLPGLAEYGRYRPVNDLGYGSLGEFLDYVLVAVPSRPSNIPHELSFYLGIPGAILLATGLLNLRRRTAAFAATAWVLLATLFAPVVHWIKDLPVVATQLPTRLRGEVLLVGVVLAADALSSAGTIAAGRLPRRAAGAGFAVVTVAILLLVTWDQATALRAVWDTAGQTTITLDDAVIEAPSARVVGQVTGTVGVTSEGPNRFVLEYRGAATTDRPALILFPAISAREGLATLAFQGGEPLAVNGYLAVRVGAPVARVVIHYSSSYLAAGLACTLVGLALFGWLLVSVTPTSRA